MKDTFYAPALIFFLALCHVCSGQDHIQKIFERTDFVLPDLHVNDAIQAKNGYLYIVGSQRSSNGDLDGVLLKLDTLNGVTSLVKKFGAGNDDELLGIIQLPEGALLLVGYSASQGEKKKSSWIIKVNYEGEIRTQKLLPSTGDRCITHVAQNEDGEVMICGWDEQAESGKIWIAALSKTADFTPSFLGNGQFKNILSLLALSSGNFFVLGSMQSTKSDYNGWYNIFSSKMEKIFEKNLGMRRTSDYLIASGLSQLDGSLGIIGETTRGAGSSDAIVFQIDKEGQLLKDTTFGGSDTDYAEGILPTLENRILIAVRSNSSKGFIYRLVLLNENNPQLITAPGKLKIAKMLLSCDNEWVTIGHWQNRQKSGLYASSFEPSFNSKSSPQVECSKVNLVDENGDGAISLNETGYLTMRLTNQGPAPLVRIRIETRTLKPVGGLEYDSPIVVAAVAKGGTRIAKIPIWGTAKLQAGLSELEIRVSIEGQLICTQKISISSMLSAGLVARRLTILDPDPVLNPRLEKRTDKEISTITIREVSPRPSLGTTKTIYRNGLRLDDSKEPAIKTRIGQEGDYFITDYQITVPLDTGRNEIYLELQEGDQLVRSIPVVLFRTRRKPTLHVLAIAPMYSNLKYNGKDARDLIEAIQKQTQSGLYDSVYIYSALSAEETSKSKLETTFEDFYLKSLDNYTAPDRIDPEDVVLVFISSHGKMVRNRFCILPNDYQSSRELSTSLDFQQMIEVYLQEIKCKMMIFIDACHSGGAKEEGLSLALNRLLSAPPGKMILSSSSDMELSYEDAAWENGAFTKALLEALNQKDKEGNPIISDTNADGFLSPLELSNYITKRVKDLAKSIGQQQTPNLPRKDMDMNLPVFKL